MVLSWVQAIQNVHYGTGNGAGRGGDSVTLGRDLLPPEFGTC